MASGMKSSKQAPGSKSKHSKHHAGGGGKEKNFLNLSIPGEQPLFKPKQM